MQPCHRAVGRGGDRPGMLQDPAAESASMTGARLAALAFCILLAGCSGAPDEPGAGPAGPATQDEGAAAPEPQSMAFDFGLGAAAGTPVLGGILPVDDQRMVSFEVPDGHTLLTATATFDCDVAPTCELDVELRRGEQDLATAGFGASPITLTLDEPEGGRYTFWAFPSRGGSVVVGMQGTLTVELA